MAIKKSGYDSVKTKKKIWGASWGSTDCPGIYMLFQKAKFGVIGKMLKLWSVTSCWCHWCLWGREYSVQRDAWVKWMVYLGNYK